MPGYIAGNGIWLLLHRRNTNSAAGGEWSPVLATAVPHASLVAVLKLRSVYFRLSPDILWPLRVKMIPIY